MLLCAAIELIIREATDHYQAGRHAPAGRLCNDAQIVRLEPDHVPSLLTLGDSLTTRQQPCVSSRSEIVAYRAAIALDQDHLQRRQA